MSEDSKKREAIDKMKQCIQCEHFRKSTKQCKLCGCFMPLKVRLPGQHCTIGKW